MVDQAPLNELAQLIKRHYPNRNLLVSYGMAAWQRVMGFARDARFIQAFNAHKELHPAPNYHWNIHTVLWAARSSLTLDGDFVELGVFKGFTSSVLAQYLDFAKVPKTWYLYDTFTGIPDEDLNKGWTNAYANMGMSYEAVVERFAAYPNIKVIKGRVPDIFDEVCPERVAFMHIDLNSAKAEVAALDRLYDRVVPGGLIVFDDFGWSQCLEQNLAEVAWAEARGLHILELPTGQGLLVKPPAP